MGDDPRVHSLTISLANPTVTKPEDLIKDVSGFEHLQIRLSTGVPASLFFKPPQSATPDWARFFDGYVPPDIFGKNSSTGAALLVNVRNKYFVLTFGTGRFLICSELLEDKFGLKVTLNSVGEDTLRSIEKDSLDPLLRHTQEQASRDASAREFGFDIEQDLLRDVVGKPLDRTLGSRMSGHQSLHMTIPVHLNGLTELLERLADKFSDTSYQSTFPWVDQISQIANHHLLEQLDTLLTTKITTGETNQIWMAVPERIEWNKVHGFQYPYRRDVPEYQDVTLEYLLRSIKDSRPITRELLSSRKVLCVDESGTKLYQWSAYECMYAELEYKHDLYLLSGGKWYSISKKFAHQVNEIYQDIKDYSKPLLEFNHISEAEYLKDLANHGDRFALMDQKNIPFGGGYSKIEFCDLFTKDHDIIHVKRYGQSTSLSHLFAQGTVSGELFQMEPEFRHEVNKRLPASHRITNPAVRPKRDQYQVVFAVVTDRPGILQLPFFSKLNFKHAARRLIAYGFRVAKAKIGISSNLSRLVKYKTKAAKS